MRITLPGMLTVAWMLLSNCSLKSASNAIPKHSLRYIKLPEHKQVFGVARLPA